VLIHPGNIHLASLLTGLSALAILLVLSQEHRRRGGPWKGRRGTGQLSETAFVSAKATTPPPPGPLQRLVEWGDTRWLRVV
jgi:hypothetical protein